MTELHSSRTVASTLIDLVNSVSFVAKVPCNIALNESLKCIYHLRVFPFKNGEQLFATKNSITGKPVKGLVQTDPFNMAIILDKAYLVSWVIELLVEGYQVVHEYHQVFHLSDCSRSPSKQGLFVELLRREDRCPDAVTQAIQAAEEEREVVGSREAVKVELLNPAALEDCNIKN